MSGNLSGFNAAEVDPNAFEDMTGTHDAMLVKCDHKVKEPGVKEGFSVTVQIISGKFQNKKIFDYINYANPNETCQRIGRAAVSSICRAVNVLTPKSFDELLNKPLKIVVKEGKDMNGDKANQIKQYMARHAAPPNGPAKQSSAPIQPEPTDSTNAAAGAEESPF